MGSKKKLIPWIEQYIPEYDRLIEPFMGSGIVFFSQEPTNAICSDLQAEPIVIANAIKNNPKKFYSLFVEYSDILWEKGDAYYYTLRLEYNEHKWFDDIDRAAKFMVLLRSGFNGLIRFSSKDNWNVSFGNRGWKGSRAQAIKLYLSFPYERFEEWSKFLNTGNKQFIQQSFEKSIQQAGEGDLIYCDPPYLITTQQYKKWNEKLEIQLADELRAASDRGAKFILSNVYIYKGKENTQLLELYKNFDNKKISHNYIIGHEKSRKQSVEEIIIFN